MPILILSPNGATTTKPTLEAARTDLDVAGKTVVVTSTLTEAQSNITAAWTSDRALRVENGGSIANSTTFTINGQFEGCDGCFDVTAIGAIKFGSGVVDKINLKWFGTDGSNNDSAKTTNQAAIKKWWNSVPTNFPKATLYVPTGTYVTKQFGNAVAGFGSIAGVWIIGEGINSVFKLASGENTFLLEDNSMFSAGIRDITFEGNNPPVSWGGSQLNPATPYLVKLIGWGMTYDGVTVKFSGGTAAILNGQQIDCRRMRAYFNCGVGIELDRCYAVDMYSTWSEGNDLGGILVRGGATTGTSRLSAYSKPSIRIEGGHFEGSSPSIELRGVCSVRVNGGQDPTAAITDNFCLISSDPTSGAGRQYSHSNVIDTTGIIGRVVIDAGCTGNTVLINNSTHFSVSSPEFRQVIIDNDGRNTIKPIVNHWGAIPISFDMTATNYIYNTNPADPNSISAVGFTVTYPVGSIFNPIVSHVSSKNSVAHIQMIPPESTVQGYVGAYTTSAAVPDSVTLYAQAVVDIPANLYVKLEIRDAVNNQYYDFDTDTWTGVDTNLNIQTAGILEYIQYPIIIDAVATRKLEVRVYVAYGYSTVAEAKQAKLYYIGLVSSPNAGLIHKRGGLIVGYGMDIGRNTTAARPAATEVPIGTRFFNTTTNQDNVSNGTAWYKPDGTAA